MPFNFKLKRTKRYEVSSKYEFVVGVHMLDNSFLECSLKADSTGHDCLECIAHMMKLEDTQYFGFRYVTKKLQFRWINLDKPLKKQLDKHAQFPRLYFGVMFYVNGAHKIEDNRVRYNYFLQLKSDVMDNRISCSTEQAVKLAALYLQVELGQYDPEQHTLDYLREVPILPNNMTKDENTAVELLKEVLQCYQNLAGLHPFIAVVYYIKQAQMLDGYGMEYYAAKDDSGGGVAVGSVILIEEDPFGQYAKMLLKYFLAESVMTGQSLFLASAGIHPKSILKDLPKPVLDESQEPEVQSDQMKIAWRYQNQNKFESNPTSVNFGHYYDLTHCMNEELIEKIDTTLVDVNQLIDSPQIHDHDTQKESELSTYEKLLQSVQETILKGEFRTQDKPAKRNILRIALHSVGSPLWGDLSACDTGDSYSEMDITLPRFLIALRFILRSAFAVAMITVPSHIFHDPGFVRRIERLSDTVVQLESFSDSEKSGNPLYKDYHGLLNIKQLPKLNSIKCQMPDVTDWAFKLKRKKLVIEKLHLPPDLSVSASRPEDHPATSAGTGMGCSGSGRSHLEF